MRRTLIGAIALALIVGCGDQSPLAVQNHGNSTTVGDQTGPVRVYFTTPHDKNARDNPNNPARALAGYIAKAQQTIDVCGYEINNVVIVDALTKAIQRGVKVRVVTDTDNLGASGIVTLKAAGVPVVDDQRQPIMHNKFMVFDNKSVWMGSMNFTENCAYLNNNNGIYIDDPRIAENYATKFKWLFVDHKFGGPVRQKEKIPNPVVKLADGTIMENYFSAHDHIANHLIEHLKTAKSSVHFLAFSFTHKGIGQAMLDRAQAGVPVQGVFEKSQVTSSGKYSQYHAFKEARQRVQVYLDANPRNMHHKVIVIDGELTVAGSFNFSDGADKDNDENVVILLSRPIAQRFEEEFQRVFGEAKAAGESIAAK
jgi:phosphatidylserine/phosphatidylglycerophosphate/cardiolipin synthase-like enzyme